LKLIAYKPRCHSITGLIEPAGQFTGDVIPEEECDNLPQSGRCDWRWMIGKYVYQNVGGPEINLTYMTLDDLQNLHVEKCLQNEI
jgi:hypothetical protein